MEFKNEMFIKLVFDSKYIDSSVSLSLALLSSCRTRRYITHTKLKLNKIKLKSFDGIVTQSAITPVPRYIFDANFGPLTFLLFTLLSNYSSKMI